jgi:hypothetical protein
MKWVALALLGLVLAAAITVAARKLSSQPIGLQSQPISAGRRLAPAPRPRRLPPVKPRPRTTTTRTVTTAPPTTVTTPRPAGAGEDGGGGDD